MFGFYLHKVKRRSGQIFKFAQVLGFRPVTRLKCQTPASGFPNYWKTNLLLITSPLLNGLSISILPAQYLFVKNVILRRYHETTYKISFEIPDIILYSRYL